MRMIEKPFRVTSRDDPAILAIMSDLAYPLPSTEQLARPALPLVSGRPIRPTAEDLSVCLSLVVVGLFSWGENARGPPRRS